VSLCQVSKNGNGLQSFAQAGEERNKKREKQEASTCEFFFVLLPGGALLFIFCYDTGRKVENFF
jgi:hypothetical protein